MSIISHPGTLSAYGYRDVRGKSELARHRALLRAVRGLVAEKKITFREAALKVFRKLNAVMILNPSMSAIFRADRDWLGGKIV